MQLLKQASGAFGLAYPFRLLQLGLYCLYCLSNQSKEVFERKNVSLTIDFRLS